MKLGAQQASLLVLPVQIDEAPPISRSTPTVAGEPLIVTRPEPDGRELAADDEHAVAPHRGRALRAAASFGVIELGLDHRAIGARSDERAVAARSCREAQRVHHDRFPGAGLAGEHVQPRAELDTKLFDGGEVSDAQRLEHEDTPGRPFGSARITRPVVGLDRVA